MKPNPVVVRKPIEKISLGALGDGNVLYWPYQGPIATGDVIGVVVEKLYRKYIGPDRQKKFISYSM